MREQQAQQALDQYRSALAIARERRGTMGTVERLDLLLDALGSLNYPLEFLLLRHRAMADERQRVLAAFATWLAWRNVVLARPNDKEGAEDYVRLNIDDLIRQYLAEQE
jgi:hypothetical protein